MEAEHDVGGSEASVRVLLAARNEAAPENNWGQLFCLNDSLIAAFGQRVSHLMVAILGVFHLTLS